MYPKDYCEMGDFIEISYRDGLSISNLGLNASPIVEYFPACLWADVFSADPPENCHLNVRKLPKT